MDAKIPIQGMAHITGGGLIDNVPRILPENCTAVIDTASWKVPAIYKFMEQEGKVDPTEMFRVFNMGIGYTIIVRPKDETKTLAILKAQRAGAHVIGHITKKTKHLSVILKETF
jgi:phosphoribosylformylglycinamidine cyclo-ligase